MKRIIVAILLAAACLSILGCGETISGIGKDVNRMGKGASTFLFRQP